MDTILSFLRLQLQRNVDWPLQSACSNTLITLIGHNSDPRLPYVNGCRSINKQFGNDSFLDWEGSSEGFRTFSHPSTALHLLVLKIFSCIKNLQSIFARLTDVIPTVPTQFIMKKSIFLSFFVPPTQLIAPANNNWPSLKWS